MLPVCLGCGAQGLSVFTGSQHPLGLALQLPDPLARDCELLTELGERCRVAIIKAVTAHQDVPMTLRELLYGLTELCGLQLPHHRACGVRGLLVLDEIAELRAVIIGAQGPVEAAGVRQGALYLAYRVHGPSELLGDLLVGRLALQPG